MKYFYNFIKNNSDIEWDDIFKFMFVRHPYDRFLSALCHEDLPEHIDERLEHLRKVGLFDQRYTVYKPQFMYALVSGANHLNFIGRYENFEEDWSEIADKLRMEEELPRLNQSKNKPVLTEEQKSKIYELYKRDFEVFGYER